MWITTYIAWKQILAWKWQRSRQHSVQWSMLIRFLTLSRWQPSLSRHEKPQAVCPPGSYTRENINGLKHPLSLIQASNWLNSWSMGVEYSSLLSSCFLVLLTCLFFIRKVTCTQSEHLACTEWCHLGETNHAPLTTVCTHIFVLLVYSCLLYRAKLILHI